ncbi:MAG: YciI family protein [Microbacteriaceae bacterium]|nr:YciI family protein [Microbacteriaceae bacterium]MCL2795270.1 YciI family protein [Microbacteriaceae bacterium]
MTQYLVLHMSAADGEEWDDATDVPALTAWIENGQRTGATRAGSPVAGREAAKAVVVRDGETAVLDGPFPEFKEWFLGFDLIEAESMEDAAALMAKHPSAHAEKLYILPNVPLPWDQA